MSKMPDKWDEAFAWSMDRIGKRVFRPHLECDCVSCEHVATEGIVITDRLQATYMTDCAMEMGYRYADTLDEAIAP